MKKIILTLAALSLILTLSTQAQVAINTTGASPDPSAMLDVSATNKGVLVPRLSSAQRMAVASPATGLLVYDTTSVSFWFYDGMNWTELVSGNPSTLADADNDTKIQVEESADEDMIRMDLDGKEGIVITQTASNPYAIPGYYWPRIEFKNNASNILIGTAAGDSLDDAQSFGYGGQNVLIGEEAGKSMTAAVGNVVLGWWAMRDGWLSAWNTAIGARCLDGNRTGAYNTALGAFAGGGTPGASNNLYLGMAAGLGATVSNRLFIDVDINAQSTDSVSLIYGNFSNNHVAINWNYANPIPQALSVNGDASKTTAGNWLANSDARLKTDIEYMNSEQMLQKILRMKGATYHWNDDKTGMDRPTALQYGFIAQDLQKVWPEKVTEDGQGYLMAAYGDYDPMFVEAIKALYQKIEDLEAEVKSLKSKSATLTTSN